MQSTKRNRVLPKKLGFFALNLNMSESIVKTCSFRKYPLFFCRKPICEKYLKMSEYKILKKSRLWKVLPGGRNRFSATLGETIYLAPARYDDWVSGNPKKSTIALVEHEKVHVDQFRRDRTLLSGAISPVGSGGYSMRRRRMRCRRGFGQQWIARNGDDTIL